MSNSELKLLADLKRKVQELVRNVPKSSSFDSAKIAEEISGLMQQLAGKPDPSRVFDWARLHKAENPFNMGPKNWERCLYDLGYPGGVAHELEYGPDGKLKYQ